MAVLLCAVMRSIDTERDRLGKVSSGSEGSQGYRRAVELPDRCASLVLILFFPQASGIESHELASARSLALVICNIIQTSYLQYTIKLDEHKTIARFVPTSTPLFRPMKASYCVCKVYCGWRYEAFAKDERDITTIVANSNISEVVENDSPQGNTDHWGLLQSRHCCHQYSCSLLL